MIADCTGLILAGGDSRRMGCDKTKLDFDGRTLLQRALDLMQGIFPRVLVSTRQARHDIQAEQVFDEVPHAGPLAGLCAGLAHSRTPWVFAVAVDMPFLEAGTIGELAARRGACDALVPVVENVPQPLAAFYALTALPFARAVLSEPGVHGLRNVLARMNVVYVPENRLHGFIDLDTPGDVEAHLHHPLGDPAISPHPSPSRGATVFKVKSF